VAGPAPADVFGNSSGGQIALELVARHPEQVRVLVAHEPPIFELLPDRAHWRHVIEAVGSTYHAEGVGPAMDRFAAAMGTNAGEPGAEEEAEAEPPEAPPPEVMEMLARLEKNTASFLAYEVPPFSRHTPDLAAVRAATATRVVLAAGEESAGEPPHRAALAVAALLHTEPVLLPGGHGGFGTHPDGFAAGLRSIFSQA
jgi:pimeloyl-ACP methyl ester carboxylesterase